MRHPLFAYRPALLCREFFLQRRDRALQRIAEHPLLRIGNVVKRIDDFGIGLDVELSVPARPVAPLFSSAALLLRLAADELRTFPMTSAPAIRSLVLFDSGD